MEAVGNKTVQLEMCIRDRPVATDVVVEVVRIDGDFDYIHLFAIFVDDEEAHARTLRVSEDERLFVSVARGVTDDTLPSLAKLFFDHAVELVSINGSGEVLDFSNANGADSAVGCLA